MATEKIDMAKYTDEQFAAYGSDHGNETTAGAGEAVVGAVTIDGESATMDRTIDHEGRT